MIVVLLVVYLCSVLRFFVYFTMFALLLSFLGCGLFVVVCLLLFCLYCLLLCVFSKWVDVVWFVGVFVCVCL